MKIIKLNAIDSTNNYLKKLAREIQLEDFTVVVAQRQTSGRGQRGTSWSFTEGQSLAFSIFKRFERLEAGQQFMISALVSLAILEAMMDWKLPKITVKWPNDIMSAKKKIGGILIENVLDKTLIKYSIVGIGINVNQMQFPNLPQAGSMRLQNNGLSFNLEEVFQKVVQRVEERLDDFSPEQFLEIKLEYENHLFRHQEISVFENDKGQRFNGIIQGVSHSGELKVKTEMGALEKFQLKDIKLIY